jgi:uncharacterized phage protein (TIGR01671 family)
MNREIKFRTWNPDDKRMEYPLVFAICSNGKLQPLIKCSDNNRAYKDYPLMQYTGLKDKNGKEIYEGDIVNIGIINGSGKLPYDGKEKERIVQVIWSEFRSSFAIKFNENANTDLFNYARNGKEFEIIGNIFENPELIQE